MRGETDGESARETLFEDCALRAEGPREEGGVSCSLVLFALVPVGPTATATANLGATGLTMNVLGTGVAKFDFMFRRYMR